LKVFYHLAIMTDIVSCGRTERPVPIVSVTITGIVTGGKGRTALIAGGAETAFASQARRGGVQIVHSDNSEILLR
jgi:hypothetical protein